MALLGKDVRLNRLMPHNDGRYLGITVDHAMARGLMRGLDDIAGTLANLVAGDPDGLTMHKGIAETCFGPYAGRVPLVLKCSTFSPFQPDEDTLVADVDEAVRLGADAISVGCIVGGTVQPGQISTLAKVAKAAKSVGMPLVAHIYPRGNLIPKEERASAEQTAYAVRLGAELGVDLIKTNYTGSCESFARVVEAAPAYVVAAGGEPGKDIRSYFQMTRDVLDAGGAGVTYGRFVFQYKNPAALIKALSFMIHGGSGVDEALAYLAEMEKAKD